MSVSAQYILAALAFGLAALGLMLLPVEADARTQGNSPVSVNSAALSVSEDGEAQGAAESERERLVQAICFVAANNPHPASQTFGESHVAIDYRGEIYRCMAGTRMRYTMRGRSYDCAQGEALWYENGRVECRTQIIRRPCNERSLLRRFGPGDKFVPVRGAEQNAVRTEATFNGAMTMDGGVGQGVW